MKLDILKTLTLVLMTILGVGCNPTPRTLPSEAMSTPTQQLVGNWEKLSRSKCSQIYPDKIQFQETGLYFGQMEKHGMFSQWDVGSFEVVSSNKIKISIANDAIITYEFSIQKDILTFIDQDGCEYKYCKLSQAKP